jgi:hypothetical protein
MNIVILSEDWRAFCANRSRKLARRGGDLRLPFGADAINF